MIVFWISFFVILYVFALYPLMLIILNKLLTQENNNRVISKEFNRYTTRTSVLIPAFNEEKNIRGRIEDILGCDYPRDRMEIIVASDGSTDSTVEYAKTYENQGVRVLDFKSNRGRAAVQNVGVDAAEGEIVVFTDAETVFEDDTIKNLIDYFGDAAVGCAVGNLIYSTSKSSISESENLYWGFEKRIRKYESNLGILATATSAVMAVRKELWRHLTPIDDSDFTTPLDVILEGFRVVYAPDAIAYDVPPKTMRGELKARIRQTSKNLIGTLNRWGWKGWIKHPLVSWSLLSHKLLRWLIPFFMVSAFVSNLLIIESGFVYRAAFLAQAAFYVLALVGFTGELFKTRIPVVSVVFSFCVANIGMGIGVLRGIMGKAPAAYKTTE